MNKKSFASEMLNFEREIINQHPNFMIAGVDEAGRGPLAGPVVAAAVILHSFNDLPPVNDSKQLSARQRSQLRQMLLQSPSIEYAIGVVEAQEIDQLNILGATFEAMRRAISQLKKVDMLFIDGNKSIPRVEIEQKTIIKGDAKSASIAAASILAKEHRDELMKEYDILYPGYGFAENMGYGTALHLQALKELGVTAIHRRSFAPVREIINPPPAQTFFDF